MPNDKLVIRELVVVEGIHDRQAVERAVQADVWVLGGERVSQHSIAELRRARAARGVIVLTDPDGPGERIRRRIDAAVPGCKHAFVAKRRATAKHGVGVEHAVPEVIVAALATTRASCLPGRDDNTGCNTESESDPGIGVAAYLPSTCTVDAATDFSLADLIQSGLVNTPGAAVRRQRVGETLGIGYGNAKAFVRKLNVLGVRRTEWDLAVAALGAQLPDNESEPEEAD